MATSATDATDGRLPLGGRGEGRRGGVERDEDGGGSRRRDDFAAPAPATRPPDLGGDATATPRRRDGESRFDLSSEEGAAAGATSDAAVVVVTPAPHERVGGVDLYTTDVDGRTTFDYSTTPRQKGVAALRLVTPRTATAADDTKNTTPPPLRSGQDAGGEPGVAIEEGGCVTDRNEDPDGGEGFNLCVGIAAQKREQERYRDHRRGSGGVDIVCGSTSSATEGALSVVPDDGASKMDSPRPRFRRLNLTIDTDTDTTGTNLPPAEGGVGGDDDEDHGSNSEPISTPKTASSAAGGAVGSAATTSDPRGVGVPLNRRARRTFPDLTVETGSPSSDEEHGREDGDEEGDGGVFSDPPPPPPPSWRHPPRVPPAPRASDGAPQRLPPPREARIALPSPTSVWEQFEEGGEGGGGTVGTGRGEDVERRRTMANTPMMPPPTRGVFGVDSVHRLPASRIK